MKSGKRLRVDCGFSLATQDFQGGSREAQAFFFRTGFDRGNKADPVLNPGYRGWRCKDLARQDHGIDLPCRTAAIAAMSLAI